MNKELYHRIVFVLFKKHFKEASEEEIDFYFHLKGQQKLFCGYCERELKYPTTYPYYNTPSIDHMRPLIREGENTFDNIKICCFQCNICKGTMFAETYQMMLFLLDSNKEWKTKILDELFIGRKANKLARLRKEKERKPMLSDYA